MKHFLFFIFIFTLYNCDLYGQSVIQSYKKETNVISKSKIALELWEYYSRYHLDSLNSIGLDLLESQQKPIDPFCKAVAYRLLGCYDVRYGEINKGLKLLESSKSIFLNLGDEKLISEAYNEIGIAYLLLGDHETARLHFEHSLSHGRNSEIKAMSYMAEINLAKTELKAGKIALSQMLTEHYIRQAIDDQKHESVANAYSFLGQIAIDKNQMKRAEYCFTKQLESSMLCDAPFIKTRAINNQAILAFIRSEYEKSIHLFLEVLEQRKLQGFQLYTCEAFMNVANFYFERADMINGALYIDSCLVLAEQHHLLLAQIEAIELSIEFDETPKLKNKLTLLRQKRKQLIDQNNNKRKSLTVKKNKAENSTHYIMLSLLIIPILLWWLYTKD
ncbi:MAG: tetratricopeptide repeat protein [Flavobacteriales bacterium]|nr:tetratricopeptide repeat protein [Flavobacteriales bacterium]